MWTHTEHARVQQVFGICLQFIYNIYMKLQPFMISMQSQTNEVKKNLRRSWYCSCGIWVVSK